MLINVYKPVGKTPLQAINKVKEVKPKLKNKKIAYAGRLDPTAEGVLLLLVEPETKNRSKYQDLDKTYLFELLIGVETDSIDPLGLITNTKTSRINKFEVEKITENLVGEIKLPYPIYSSKPVKGKPLFWWARNNKLDQISIPMKHSQINQIETLGFKNWKKKELKNYICNKIEKVDGDFSHRKNQQSFLY